MFCQGTHLVENPDHFLDFLSLVFCHVAAEVLHRRVLVEAVAQLGFDGLDRAP